MTLPTAIVLLREEAAALRARADLLDDIEALSAPTIPPPTNGDLAQAGTITDRTSASEAEAHPRHASGVGTTKEAA